MSEWRFLLDENIDPKTVTYPQKEVVHAEHVRDALWQGADDEDDVLPYAQEHASCVGYYCLSLISHPTFLSGLS